ncbi:MAG: hypothetical protein PHD95_06680 [Candidatus ainarchaeum sp.]|nr:hypothetical protein [Candidatus ainarchaeum sp.]
MFAIIFLGLIAAAAILFETGQAAIGIACIIAALLFATAKILQKLGSATKKTAKALGRGVPEEVEKAEGQFPSNAIWEEGLKEMGDKAGKQLFAPGDYPYKRGKMESYRWVYKGNAGASAGIKKLAEAFKKLMGM